MSTRRVDAVPVGSAGTLLAGRYRLLELISATTNSGVSLWRGEDEVLARAVGVRMLPVEPRQRSEAFLAAARRTALVSHPGLVRMYDAGIEDVHAFAVAEWVDGMGLDAVVDSNGPLDPDAATTVLAGVAEALEAAAASGLHHGRLHPGNVLLSTDGRVRVSGVATAAAAAGTLPDSDDARSVGRLLYYALTGCWPGAERPDLPAAPQFDGRLCTPRQVRAGVPAGLDRLVRQMLEPPAAATPATDATTGLADRVRSAGGATRVNLSSYAEPAVLAGPSLLDADGEAAASGSHSRRARSGRAAVVAGIAALVAGAGYLAGSALDVLPGGESDFPALHHSAAASVAPRQGGVVHLPVVSAHSFDPFGDRTENDDQVPLALDNDPGTAWHTDRYYGQPAYGGLKPGVGLLLDLGKPEQVSAVHLTLETPGADIELRAGDIDPTTPDELSLTGSVKDAPQQTSVQVDDGAHRYWLVWITKLPPVPGGYREGIAAIALDGTRQS